MSGMATGSLQERVGVSWLLDKVMSPTAAAALIKPGMVLGFSGFASAGYPKLVPEAIAARGEAKGLTVLAGASTGPELDGELAEAGLIARRAPFQSEKQLRESINAGGVDYCDIHLSQMPKYLREETFGHIDYAIIECVLIDGDSGVVPTTTLGAVDTIMHMAEKVILEINTSFPTSLKGMHDIYAYKPGEVVPITGILDRIGTPTIHCPPEKVAAIVINETPGKAASFQAGNEVSDRIAGHIIDFLKEEVKRPHYRGKLPPLQSGLGNVANAVLYGLRDSGFKHLTMYTEVVQDTAFELMRAGIIDGASTTSLSLSAESRDELFANMDYYKKRIVIRSQDISNNPELIQRFGVIGMNTAIEADIYGNVNSTHIMGSGTMNGVGGSCDFARNAGVTIFMTPATAKGGRISCIVPMVSHVDSTEHDVHVIVTEYGLADLRGKSPKERAELIIENCAAPEYRGALREYLRSAEAGGAQHTPHDLAKALSWHVNYLEKGSML